MAVAPGVPAARLRRAPPRARHDGRPTTPSPPGATLLKATRRCSRSSSAASSAAPRCRPPDGEPLEIRAPLRGRRRRRQQPLRPRARHVPHARVAVRHGHPHLLGDAAPRRAVDRIGARREGPQRQPDARLRLDLPGRRRHRQHRRRAAVARSATSRASTPRTCSTPTPIRSPSAGRSTPTNPECKATSGRIPMGGSVGPKAGPTLPRDRRRRRQRQPVQRRGHRLRLRDRAHGRAGAARGARRRRSDRAAALPDDARRRVRRVLQGRPAVRPGHRPTGVDARADPRRHAQPHA